MSLLEGVGGVLVGVGGLGALLTPWLVSRTSRRQGDAAQRSEFVDDVQAERDRAVTRADRLETDRDLWRDAYFRLRHWVASGAQGNPPTMPGGMSSAAVTARLPA